MKIFYSSIGIILLVILIFLQNKKGFQIEERMSFITLGVKNLTTSADFYENKFGWTRSKMSNENIMKEINWRKMQLLIRPAAVLKDLL